jgi:adenosylmethionine-8-amino-7-oxononanoate aminotransferase
VLAFAPPLIIQKAEIDQLFATARENTAHRRVRGALLSDGLDDA